MPRFCQIKGPEYLFLHHDWLIFSRLCFFLLWRNRSATKTFASGTVSFFLGNTRVLTRPINQYDDVIVAVYKNLHATDGATWPELIRRCRSGFPLSTFFHVSGHIEEFSCPPIRGCYERYGCHIRQRVGHCPFCKCCKLLPTLNRGRPFPWSSQCLRQQIYAHTAFFVVVSLSNQEQPET